MSLRARLTLWFTAVLAIAMILFGALVYALLNGELHADVDASVENKAHDAALSVRYENQQFFVPTRVRVPESQFRAPTLYTEIRDIHGEVVWRSDTLQGSDLPASAATLASAKAGTPVIETVFQAGQAVRLYTAPILVNGRVVGYVQVGRNLADIDAALKQLRLWLVVSIVIALAAAGGGGWLLAHAALRPIDQIIQAARAIGQAQRLDRRLPTPPVADEIGHLAATFNEMLDRLEAAFVAQQRFVADASHELRTPLTTIQGNVEFLLRNPDMPAAERIEALNDVADEASRMARLVNGLLALARADAGRHLERRPVELRAIIENCFHHAQALARPRTINVELALNRLEPGARVMADPDRLGELFTILLDNAVKYNRPNGLVRLTARTEGRTHRISVSDTGRGIAPEDLPHVFERFYRSPHARSEDGTGLGLAIARWIASEHNARITVESVPDVGSTFTVTLPALEPAPLLPVS
ncbi:MAG TPA: HAMP domain-containing sensor histidine kinase [Chloroflexota bacterium]|nr:HAMP domain-containing sensor histidine kinase [Chloroflexota bacterium]